MTPLNSTVTGSEHDSLMDDLERALAASSDSFNLNLDHYFDFTDDGPEPGRDHRANVQLPWTIGSSGRWPPSQYMMGCDPHLHAECQFQSLPPQQPWTQMIPHPNFQITPDSSSQGHHQYPPAFNEAWPRDLLSSQLADQQIHQHPSQHHILPHRDLFASNRDNAASIPPTPPRFPNPPGLPQLTHDSPYQHPPLMPVSGPSSSGLTQAIMQALVPPHRDQSAHIEKVSTRASRRHLKAKGGVEGGREDSEAIQTYKFVPSNSSDVLLACREEMKRSIFKTSLLPTTTETATLAQSSWEAAVNRQSAELRDWAQPLRRSQEKGLTNIVDSIRKDMRDLVMIFVYFQHNLQTYGMDVSHLINRGGRVLHLTAEDSRFLDVTLTVNGKLITVPFGNPNIMSYIGYMLYDSRYQYHRYISCSDWTGPSPGHGESALSIEKMRPLFTMTGILYRWALEERKTGIVIDSDLWVNSNQTFHLSLVDKFKKMTPEQKAALQILVDGVATCPLK